MCHKFGFISVALYDSIGLNAVQYVVDHAEIAVAFVGAKQLDILLKAAKDSKTLKKLLICMDQPSEAQIKACKA